VEHRAREPDVGQCELGDDRAEHELGHGQADNKRDREHAVDQRLAEFAGAGELGVEVQRRRVSSSSS
jgi:hypothetical protein